MLESVELPSVRLPLTRIFVVGGVALFVFDMHIWLLIAAENWYQELFLVDWLPVSERIKNVVELLLDHSIRLPLIYARASPVFAIVSTIWVLAGTLVEVERGYKNV